MTTTVKPQRGLDNIQAYVPGKPIEEVKREYNLQDVIKLASNENPLGPSPKAVAAVKGVLDQVNFYPDGASYDLRQALAAYWQMRLEQVAVGNGADGLIMQVCLAYLGEDDEAIVSLSSFPVYDVYIQLMRAKLIKTPLKNYGLDLEAMAAAITPRTKLIFVCNPNNPTGTMVTAAEVDAFMQRVPDETLVIFDEAYYEFVDSDAYPDTLRYVREGRKNVLVLRTFSKIFGLAGVRLGYGMAEPEVLAPMNKIKEPFAVSLLAQAAGIAALGDQACLKASTTANAAGRLYFYQEFARLGLLYVKSHTNFVLVQVGPKAGAVSQALLKRGIIVRPGGGYKLPEFLRITVGTPEQNARLIGALESILSELA